MTSVLKSYWAVRPYSLDDWHICYSTEALLLMFLYYLVKVVSWDQPVDYRISSKGTPSQLTLLLAAGPCLTTEIWRCHKPFSQWQHNFQRKLCSHWLKFFWQRHIAVVSQGPDLALPANSIVSMPAVYNSDLTHQDIVSREDSLWGFLAWWKCYQYHPSKILSVKDILSAILLHRLIFPHMIIVSAGLVCNLVFPAKESVNQFWKCNCPPMF